MSVVLYYDNRTLLCEGNNFFIEFIAILNVSYIFY